MMIVLSKKRITIMVLGVFLYDYIPTNKIVPKIEQYQAPQSIQNELSETVNSLDEEMSPIIYEIDGTDLNNYEKSNDYEKGKVNPFSATDAQTNNNTVNNANGNTNNNGNNNSNINNNTNNNTNTNNNSNSVGNYLPNTGTK